MLHNVWSAEVFKKKSSKAFSRGRSQQLEKIDRALVQAHILSPMTDAGMNALIDLFEAINAWQETKKQQGKNSGRARAVDQLRAQLCEAAERIFDRKIAAAKSTVQNDLQRLGLMQRKMKLPLPPLHGLPNRPLPPTPPAIPKRNAAEDRLYDYLAQAMIDQRRKVMFYDDEDLFDDLEAEQKVRLAARWMLSIPNTVRDPAAARGEALRILAAMLGNNVGIIKNLLERNLEVVVIPRDQGMTVLEQFASIRGEQTLDGRSWDSVRGIANVEAKVIGGLNEQIRDQLEAVRNSGKSGKGPGCIVAIDPDKGRIYTGITEENLLGGLTSAPGGGCYAIGYSTTTHEFAHSIHQYGLTDDDRITIDKIYKMRLQQAENEEWVDGPRKVGFQSCYASTDAFEYFAQLSNAWLGVNLGLDPYTNKPRNNGKQWVIDHEPKMISDILERVYGSQALEDLNPEVIIKS